MIARHSTVRSSDAILLYVLAAIFLSAPWSRAEDSPPQRRMENRFLFVIDTSSAMKSRREGVEQAVTGLLASGMRGELRKGDTIGLWTYNDSLSTDFPMQVWSEKKQNAILSDVSEHLHSLVYEKRAHLEKAWPAMQQVVANSERLTLILIFDGSDSIKGTTFDKEMNKLHKQYARDFRSAHQPFVTVLAARDGHIFDYTINHPSLVMLPHMADPVPPPPEPIEPQPLVVTPPPPEATTPPRPRIQINLSGADFPHSASPTPPAVTNVEAAAAIAAAPAVTAPANPPSPAQAEPVAAPPTRPLTVVNTNVTPAESGSAPPVTTPPKLTPVAPASSPGPAVVLPNAGAPGQPVAILIIAFSLLTIAVALVVLVWRWRGRSQPSLISRSIDQSR